MVVYAIDTKRSNASKADIRSGAFTYAAPQYFACKPLHNEVAFGMVHTVHTTLEAFVRALENPTILLGRVVVFTILRVVIATKEQQTFRALTLGIVLTNGTLVHDS